MTRDEALQKLREARVGRLATVRPDGTPHVIPFVFALVEGGDDLRVYWAVDDKPKRSVAIQRLANIESNPAVEFVVDEYDDDWAKLWWVRVRGSARVVGSQPERAIAIAALARRYTRYADLAPGRLIPIVSIDVTGITGWQAR